MNNLYNLFIYYDYWKCTLYLLKLVFHIIVRDTLIVINYSKMVILRTETIS